MEYAQIQAALDGLPLGGIRYFERTGSTNDEARRWAAEGAPDFAVVVANEQTAGRGRSGRTWYSPADSSLAFSVVVHPHSMEPYTLPRLTALGALAVNEVFHQQYGLPAQIKWPNDILIHRQKVGGVLAEALWEGEHIQALVLGIGLNIAPEAARIANQFAPNRAIPATSVEAVLGKPVDRLKLLRAVLETMLIWRERISTQAFLATWEANLAFRGEWVQVVVGDSASKDGLPRALEVSSPVQAEGIVLGLAQDGSLRLRAASGAIVKISAGEIHLRPAKPALREHPVS